jgi:capsular exopolysaccharide synthesis family protein
MRELIVNNYPKSSVTEAIKAVRTNLRFSAINEKVKTILVTSSVAGEGKSFIAANLGATFASSKEKVLIVDCDLRRGRQLELFGKGYYLNLGLSNLLIDENWKKNLKKYIQTTEVQNLDIITTGSLPPNPTILLESKKMELVVEELKKKYDVIIFDTPPVGGLTDALIMSRLADAVLIVARSKKTTMELLENTKKALENVGASIAGVILNQVDKKDSKYYKNYYYYQD